MLVSRRFIRPLAIIAVAFFILMTFGTFVLPAYALVASPQIGNGQCN